MKKFLIFLCLFFCIAVCSCTSLHMVLDGLEHAEIEVSNQPEDIKEYI